MDQVLEGKVAIITGGAGGIGSVFGRALAERGAAVVLGDINVDGAVEAAEGIAAGGFHAYGTHLEVTDPASAQTVVDGATRTYGGVDILVNSAALMAEIPHFSLSEFPVDWWDRVMEVNVKGPLVCSQAVIPTMIARGGGRIVNMASAGAYTPGAVYGVSKHTLTGLTRNLAHELGPKGIHVNAIAPGLVTDEAGFRALPAGARREALRATVPLKTHIDGAPEDLVGALVLLVSQAGAWITGQTLSVDGGWIMR